MASKNQKQLLLALESGVKLADAIREPGMPSKMLLQEWLDNPEFSRKYDTATTIGREKRLAKIAQPEPVEPVAPRPAVLRGQQSPEVVERSRELSQKLTEIIGDGDTYSPAAQPAPAPRPDTTALQNKILHLIRSGVPPTKLLKGISGYNPTVLAQWRKDEAFRAKYEAAKKEGATKPAEGASQPTAQATPEPAAFEPEPASLLETPKKGELEKLREQVALYEGTFQGYEEWGNDIKRLTRELDVALFGEEGASKQASLCDLISPARKLAEDYRRLLSGGVDGDSGDVFIGVLHPFAANQQWLTKGRAQEDAEHHALKHNRMAIVARVVAVVKPTVEVKEV